MILNSYKKALICMVPALFCTLAWFIGSAIFMASVGKISWILLALNCTFQILPTFIFVGMVIPFSRRLKAAEAKGFVLCSRCEYLLASEIEQQTCPECGCTRSITAHKEAWKGWRSWLT